MQAAEFSRGDFGEWVLNTSKQIGPVWQFGTSINIQMLAIQLCRSIAGFKPRLLGVEAL